MGDVRRGWRAWAARHAAAVLLMVTVAGLIAGGLLYLAGRADAAEAAWFAVGGCGALYALWSMADSLRHRRIGVDVIALLAAPAGICECCSNGRQDPRGVTAVQRSRRFRWS